MQSFKNILFVVTSDSYSELALTRAYELAKSNQAKLTLVEAIEKIPENFDFSALSITAQEMLHHITLERQKRLDEIVTKLDDDLNVEIKIVIGTPHIEIIRLVVDTGCEMVIKSADDCHRFSSQDLNLLRKCPCPVWLMGSESRKHYKKIIATVDVDDDYDTKELETRRRLNYQIIEVASSIAVAESAELHIVHAWRAVGESALQGGFLTSPKNESELYAEKVKQRHQQNLDQLMADFSRQFGVDTVEYLVPKIRLLKGWPSKVIPSYINETHAELVVMGTVCRTGISGFFIGNTAESIFSQTSCSILAVKPEGFITPVTIKAN